MKDRTHSISKVINTDIKTLFKVVSDFNNYKNWNTVIPDAKGELIVGTELQLTININGKTKPFNPKVLSVIPNKCFLLRSEEHTSELQSRPHLVCRLLLEKKKKKKNK